MRKYFSNGSGKSYSESELLEFNKGIKEHIKDVLAFEYVSLALLIFMPITLSNLLGLFFLNQLCRLYS